MTESTNGKSTAPDLDPRDAERLMRRAVQAALWRHRVLGETIAVADGDRIIHLTGDEIPVSKPEP